MKDKGLELFLSAIGSAIAGILVAGYGLYWLTTRAIQGDTAAAVIVVIVGMFGMLVFALVAYMSVVWVNQKQDERASAAMLRMLQFNALENASLLEANQKTALLQARTAKEQVSGTITQAKLVEMLQAQNPVDPSQFLLVDDTLYQDLEG